MDCSCSPGGGGIKVPIEDARDSKRRLHTYRTGKGNEDRTNEKVVTKGASSGRRGQS